MEKNKIDIVIDEVLESKRLKKGVSILVIGGIIFVVVAVVIELYR